MSLECTACNSQNTQKLSIIYASGLSTDRREGFGAVGGQVGYGVSRGVQQTALSELAAPPKFNGGHGIMMVILAVMFLIVFFIAILFAGKVNSFSMFCLIAATVSFLFSKTQLVADWDAVQQKVQDEYYKSYMCLACGHKFINHDE